MTANGKDSLEAKTFEEWFEDTDLGELTEEGKGKGLPGLAARAGKGRPRIGRKITLVLPEETIQDLTRRAAKKGIGYQTYARMILMSLKDDEAS
jgi:hypothetical protein